MVMWDANVPVCCSRCAPVRAAAMRLSVAGAVSAPTADVQQVRRATVRTQRHAHHFSPVGRNIKNPVLSHFLKKLLIFEVDQLFLFDKSLLKLIYKLRKYNEKDYNNIVIFTFYIYNSC